VKQVESLDQEQTRALELLRALGNPARLRIVAELAARAACVTGDLVGVLPLAQSTVSEHLKVLREAGVIAGTVDGDLCYCLDPAALRWLASFCDRLASPCAGDCGPAT
jgi:ArsR family transcriptional regulator